eukprot:TRINITY_DN6567_c0_g1_i1.p1 TRINITY_DN6567_c0_g1~~TRINITY_DN6567_c0_g1_i1.p1  ORF type:complete len:250 (-),score=33.53 TRINITY_DN6567_c0_g1_i1:437-1186(-)
MPGLVTTPVNNQSQQSRTDVSQYNEEALYRLVSEQDRQFLENVQQLRLGDRLQVLWQIEERSQEDSNEPVITVHPKWWGCKLLGPAFREGVEPSSEALMKDYSGRQLWRIQYDEEESFEQEVRLVSFTNVVGEIYDNQEQGLLSWRLEGDYDSDYDSEDQSADLEDNDDLVDIHQFASTISDDLLAQMEQEAMSWMSNLPAAQQLQIMSSMRSFIDHIVQGVAGVAEGNSVITREHIVDIIRRFREQNS